LPTGRATALIALRATPDEASGATFRPGLHFVRGYISSGARCFYFASGPAFSGNLCGSRLRCVIEMRIPEGDHKERRYQVVSMKPIDHASSPEVGATDDKPLYDKPSAGSGDKPLANQLAPTPPPTKPN